jgi:hypothetical protein
MSDFKSKLPLIEVYNGITPGTVIASKAVITDGANKVNTLDITALKIGGAAVATTAAEINNLDNLTRGSIIVGGVANATGKLDAKTSGQILVGDGTDLASVAVSGDATLAANGALTLAVPKVKVISKLCAIAGFTDNLNTTGYIDFTADSLPAGAIPIGWKAVVTAGFAGDATAVIQVGVAGDLARFSAEATQSVFAVGTIGCGVPQDKSCDGIGTVSTPRVTVTGGADFTSIVTEGNGSMTVYLYYIATV